MSARPRLLAAALVAATALITSCGSEEPSDEGAEAAGGAGEEATDEGAAAFPVTVDTAFGEVTIEEEPERVVALGWSDAETALALGVEPVGASDWLGFGGEGVGPWAQGRYDEAPELIDTLEPSLEAIAALDPDLILDTRSDATQERYDALSQIAPVVGQPEGVGPYQTSWQDQLELVGAALGKAEEAEALEEDLLAQFEQAREAHPEFDGTQVAVGAYTSEGFGAYVGGDTRVDFMEALGFELTPEIQALAEDNFYIPVSNEQLGLLDAELTVIFPIFVPAEEITSNPLWPTLGSVQQGNAVVLDDEELVSAFSSGSALGIEYALDNAVPQFADALNG